MHKLGEVYPTIVEDLAYHGARFTHHTSIAPTGTIALAFANNASNGIEPSFAHQYTRNLTKQGRKTREAVEVYSAEALLWREKYGDTAYPDYFVTAEQVSPKEHIDVQAVAQRWVDSSISKTINCPTGMSFEEFKEVYRYAYEMGLKGCATFRFNPEFQQGILVTAENLANTQYRFRLDDGTLIEARGDDVIEYEGESHSVANLYDALKEGRYGRY
jgi:ribonucleoside-diphosphate reductase alpha chain